MSAAERARLRGRVARSPGCPRSSEGTALGELIAGARRARATATSSSISQKIVSKAEGRVRRLSSVDPRRRGAASWPPCSARSRRWSS